MQHCLTFSTSRKDKPGAFCRQIRPASTAGSELLMHVILEGLW